MIRINLSPKWTNRVKPRRMGPRAREVIDFVREHPGCKTFVATLQLLTEDDKTHPTTRPFKRAQSAVARVIRDRLVLHDSDRLYPWDKRLFLLATQAERAGRDPAARHLAADAWRRAGDNNRAKILVRLAAEDGNLR